MTYDPYYITPIVTTINYQLLENYIKNKKDDSNITENIINKLETCRKKICNSKTYIELNKFKNIQSITAGDRWKMINIKKNNISNLFSLLNKLTESTIDSIIESLKDLNIDNYDELVKIADIYAGKSTLEVDNLKLLTDFLIRVNKIESWYIKYNNTLFSFREIVIITLQKEFYKLIDMAGQLENRYKDNIDNETLIVDFVKKKNILIGLIKFLAELFNQKMFSNIVSSIILYKLYDEYNNKKQLIYLELFIIYFDMINTSIIDSDEELYHSIIEYLQNIVISDNRINYIKTALLNKLNIDNIYINEDTLNDLDDICDDITTLDNQFEFLITEYKYTKDYDDLIITMKKKLDQFGINKYIDYMLLYITRNINDIEMYELLKQLISNLDIKKDIINNRLIKLLKDEDILCELPLLSNVKIDKLYDN